MAPRPPAARPNGQSGASMRKPTAPPPTDGKHTHGEREGEASVYRSVWRSAMAPRTLPRRAMSPSGHRPGLTHRCCPAPAVPPAIDDADYEAFEGLFESARTRRATQQRATAELGASGDNPTASMQERVYGAVLSPRVIRSGLDTWTRAVSVGATGVAPGAGACGSQTEPYRHFSGRPVSVVLTVCRAARRLPTSKTSSSTGYVVAHRQSPLPAIHYVVTRA